MRHSWVVRSTIACLLCLGATGNATRVFRDKADKDCGQKAANADGTQWNTWPQNQAQLKGGELPALEPTIQFASGHRRVESLAFIPGLSTRIGTSETTTLRSFGIDGKLVGEIDGTARTMQGGATYVPEIRAVAKSGTFLIAGAPNVITTIHSIPTLTHHARLVPSRTDPYLAAVMIDEDSTHIIGVTNDGLVKRWPYRLLGATPIGQPETFELFSTAVSDAYLDGDEMIVVTPKGVLKRFKLPPVSPSRESRAIRAIKAYSGQRFMAEGPLRVVPSPDGRLSIVFGVRGARELPVLWAYDWVAKAEPFAIAAPQAAVFEVVMRGGPEPRLLGLTDDTVEQWSLVDGAHVGTFAVHRRVYRNRSLMTDHPGDPIFSMALGPDGDSLVTGTLDGMLVTWSLRTGRVVRAYDTGEGEIAQLSFSPSGTLVGASGHHGFAGLFRASDLVPE